MSTEPKWTPGPRGRESVWPAESVEEMIGRISENCSMDPEIVQMVLREAGMKVDGEPPAEESTLSKVYFVGCYERDDANYDVWVRLDGIYSTREKAEAVASELNKKSEAAERAIHKGAAALHRREWEERDALARAGLRPDPGMFTELPFRYTPMCSVEEEDVL